uniref:Uncharacterized protein n=1 Tax=Arundo donax TaxID=35708 RepID=A0A0A9C8F1_ARUDO
MVPNCIYPMIRGSVPARIAWPRR